MCLLHCHVCQLFDFGSVMWAESLISFKALFELIVTVHTQDVSEWQKDYSENRYEIFLSIPDSDGLLILDNFREKNI